MTLDAVLLLAAGLLAILGGGAILFLGRDRYPSFLAAASLVSLGLLQFGWARTIYDVTDSEVWFELSLAFALPVSLLWFLTSRSLFRRPGQRQSPVWRVYIVVQALSAIAALLFVGFTPTWVSVSFAEGGVAFPLRHAATAMVVAILLNITLATASFESIYFSLPREVRRGFRPGLLGILFAAACYGYRTISCLTTRSISSADLSLGWVPVSALALLLPFSLIRGRLTEARVRRRVQPVIQTTSLALSAGIIALTAALVWLTHATGWSVARGIWVVFACTAALAIAALTFSNRVNRRVQRLVDPILYRRIDRREITEHVEGIAGGARDLSELCSLIPGNVRAVLGTDPVTLFLFRGRDARFVVVASTLTPSPDVAVLASEPLATELGRTRRAIHLRGRADDLEYIPIYVENAAQIAACAALCAAPLLRRDELLGFLLCGEQGHSHSVDRPLLPLLDLICRRYSDRLDSLEPPPES